MNLKHLLWGGVVGILLVFGIIADRALVNQARLTEEAALTESDSRARLTAASVRAVLAAVELDVLTGTRSSGVTTSRLAKPSWLAGPSVPYRERSASDLGTLVSSEGLTESGLPEAVVAALALGRADMKAQVAERLLSGR